MYPIQVLLEEKYKVSFELIEGKLSKKGPVKEQKKVL